MRLRSLLPAAVAALTALAVAAPASAAAGSNALDPDQALGPGQRLVSADGQYVLTMQGDGNLVAYAPGNRAIWSTGTGGTGSSLVMQGDGNLVVYAPTRPDRTATWSSGTRGGLRLELQNDGNLVLYTRDRHVASWSSAAITDRGNTGQVRYSAYVTMRDRGWADSEWRCLDALWTGESGWRWNATNRSSGAYGIPQSLPAAKMAANGADWRDNPATQIAWGLDYIRSKYGSPCGALSKWQSRSPHWY